MTMHPYSGRLQQIVMQPTPFCNLDCSYCYLPHRHRKVVMNLDVVDATIRFAQQASLLGSTVEVRWHAGEPLAVSKHFYTQAFERFAHMLGPEVAVEHSIQTNGVLLDAAWASLLDHHGVRIGVSIDGPAVVHDEQRRTRRGSGTFDRVMRGVEHLQKLGLRFDVIAVVTPATLRRAAEFCEFFTSLYGLRELGLNVEESEGDHTSKAFATEDFEHGYRAFLADLYTWSIESGVVIREFRTMRSIVIFGTDGVRNTQNEAFAILTVGANGDVATFSPELLGMVHSSVDGFSIGNVLSDSPEIILRSARLRRLEAEIECGTSLCRSTCAYFSMCGGGAPVNKLYENGAFATTETRHCRLVTQAVADHVLDALEREACLRSQSRATVRGRLALG